MKHLIKALSVWLFLVLCSSGAYAQNCSGQSPSGNVCGNPNASTGLPSWATLTALIDRAMGSSQGSILNRGASVWTATQTPSLGVNGGTGGALTLNGSTSGSVQVSVQAAAGTATLFQLPNTNGTNNQVLSTDGSGHTSWTSVAGTGTVTSVGLALPVAIFTVSGSPVTNSGTLTGTLTTQSANSVWAGPTTGAAATPTFRSLVGADLPNPSASTLGGIESFASVSHQWINQISTSGVPSASQPAFTDISGTATTGQIPTASTILDTIDNTQGDVLYRGASGWSALPTGTIGQVLTAGGSGANPSWTTVGGTGTVTSVGTGAGLVGGTITTSGTISLASIASGDLLANLAVGTNPPVATTPSAVLDTFGTAQGNILYRAGGAWTALGPGTSGQILQTNGAGANPTWVNNMTGTIDAGGTTSITNGKSRDYLVQSNSATLSHTGFPYAAMASISGAL